MIRRIRDAFYAIPWWADCLIVGTTLLVVALVAN